MGKSQSSPSAPADLLPFYRTLNGSLPELVSDYGQQVSKQLYQWQQEASRFMQERLGEDLQTAQEAARCKTLPELLAVQQGWASKATADYFDEMQRVQKLFSEAAAKAWAPMDGWLSKVVEDSKSH